MSPSGIAQCSSIISCLSLVSPRISCLQGGLVAFSGEYLKNQNIIFKYTHYYWHINLHRMQGIAVEYMYACVICIHVCMHLYMPVYSAYLYIDVSVHLPIQIKSHRFNYVGSTVMSKVLCSPPSFHV